MSESSSDVNPLDALAEEFVARCRAGEHPSLDEFIARRPDLADDIRDLFPGLVVMEGVRPDKGDVTGPFEGAAVPALKRLGDFRILREVGRGGMGVVYEAEQESLGRRVALKVLPAHSLIESQRLQRFQREARAAARLHHTNIVPVYGVGECDGLHYYVMQFIHGLGLDQVLRELTNLRCADGGPAAGAASDAPAAVAALSLLTGRFTAPAPDADEPSDAKAAPPPAVESSSVQLPGQPEASGLSESGRQYWQSIARVGVQVADALGYAAVQGTLHRDVKPSNLLLDGKGNVWVTDFGLAKTADSGDLTHTGDIVGTLRYMAPERFNGKGDVRSDLYGLGLTLYELLALRPAFDETDRNKLIQQVLHAEPPRLRKVNRAVPRDLETIVHKAIDKDPARRYQTAQELADDLRRFVDDRPIRARRVTAAERLWRLARRNPVVAWLLLAVFGALAAGAVTATVFAFQARSEQKRADAKADEAARNAQQANAKADEADENARLAREERKNVSRLLYDARMRLINRALENHETPVVRGLLNELRPAAGEDDLRGFEWHYVWRAIHGDLRTTRIDIVTFADEKVSAWNLGVGLCADGERLAECIPPAAPLGSTDLLKDGLGKWELRIWETTAPRVLFSRKSVVFGMPAISRDGRRAVYASGPGEVTVWDVDGDRELAAFKTDKLPLRLHFNAAGDRLVVVAVGLTTELQDGKPATVLDDKQIEVQVREIPTGRLLSSGPAPENGMDYALGQSALSPDGKRLAAYGWFGSDEARLWDVPAGKEVTTWKLGEGKDMASPCFSADSRWLATSANDSITVRDAATGKKAWTLSTAGHAVSCLTFSPDGRRLAAGGAQSGVFLFDIPQSDIPPGAQPDVVLPTQTLLGHDAAVVQTAFTADGRRLRSLDRTGALKEWDMARTEIRPLGGSGIFYNGSCFSADGRRLALSRAPEAQLTFGMQSGYFPGAPVVSPGVEVWETSTGARRLILPVDAMVVRSLALSRDGRRLALWQSDQYGGNDGVAAALTLGLAVRPWGTDALLTAAWNAGRLTPRADRVRVIDVDSGRDVWSEEGRAGPVEFSPDGRRLLIGATRQDVAAVLGGPMLRTRDREKAEWKVVDLETGREMCAGQVDEQTVYQIAFHPDGKRLALWTARTPKADATRDESIMSSELSVMDLTTGGRDATLPLAADRRGFPRELRFSPDGKRLIAVAQALPGSTGGSEGARFMVWDADADRRLAPLLTADSTTEAYAVSQDGRWMATAADTRSPVVRVWDLATGREQFTLRGHSADAPLAALAFSPDGRRLLSVGRRYPQVECKIWDMSTGQELLTLSPRVQWYGSPDAIRFDGERILILETSLPSYNLRVIDGSPAGEADERQR